MSEHAAPQDLPISEKTPPRKGQIVLNKRDSSDNPAFLRDVVKLANRLPNSSISYSHETKPTGTKTSLKVTPNIEYNAPREQLEAKLQSELKADLTARNELARVERENGPAVPMNVDFGIVDRESVTERFKKRAVAQQEWDDTIRKLVRDGWGIAIQAIAAAHYIKQIFKK